jgi:hypothetical protein
MTVLAMARSNLSDRLAANKDRSSKRNACFRIRYQSQTGEELRVIGSCTYFHIEHITDKVITIYDKLSINLIINPNLTFTH